MGGQQANSQHHAEAGHVQESCAAAAAQESTAAEHSCGLL
jgi:hypothetical protein